MITLALSQPIARPPALFPNLALDPEERRNVHTPVLCTAGRNTMEAKPAQPRSHQEWSDDQRQGEDHGRPAGMGLAEFPDVGRVEEVAAVLRCSKWCVYDLINTGALKSIRLGRAIRVTRRALEEFLSL